MLKGLFTKVFNSEKSELESLDERWEEAKKDRFLGFKDERAMQKAIGDKFLEQINEPKTLDFWVDIGKECEKVPHLFVNRVITVGLHDGKSQFFRHDNVATFDFRTEEFKNAPKQIKQKPKLPDIPWHFGFGGMDDPKK